jgi:hypothetical protein
MRGWICLLLAASCAALSHPPKLPQRHAPICSVTITHARCSPVAQPLRPRAAVHMIGNLPPGGGGQFDPKSLVGPAVLIFLIASGALGWIFNFLNGFFLLLFVVPLVATPIANWWLSNNLLDGTCPTCGAPNQVIKGQQGRCLSCGATMSSELSSSGIFLREGSVSREDGVVDIDID